MAFPFWGIRQNVYGNSRTNPWPLTFVELMYRNSLNKAGKFVGRKCISNQQSELCEISDEGGGRTLT